MALFTTRLIQPYIDKKVFVILNFICIKKNRLLQEEINAEIISDISKVIFI